VSCNRLSALVAPSDECLQGKGLVWLIGAVVCSLADYRGFNCSLAHETAAFSTIGSCRSSATSDDCNIKRSWSGFPVRRAITSA